MLLMIDNFDSFTYNLVYYFKELHQQVAVYRNNAISIEAIQAINPKYIVISPGPCDPDQAGISLDIIRTFAGKIPILGVCLGHQCIGQAFGGEIVRADKVMHGRVSDIYHHQQGIFKQLSSPLSVTRYHSLVIEKKTLPSCFDITAWTDADEIMAIKHKTMALEGVQFHPESILSQAGHELLNNFLIHYNQT